MTDKPLTTRAVVTICRAWRCVCSAMWNRRPKTVDGSLPRPTSRGSLRLASGVERNTRKASSDTCRRRSHECDGFLDRFAR